MQADQQNQSTIPQAPPPHGWRKPIDFFRARFLIGVDFLAPFLITYIVIDFLVEFARDVFGPFFREWFGHEIPGLGFAIILGAPLLFGALALHFFGVRAMVAIESTAARLPIVGPVFAVSHQIVSAFGGGEETGFRSVVTFEYPRRGLWSLGFLTRVVTLEDGSEVAMIYVPTTPTPNSGNLVMVPLDEIKHTNMRVNDLMRTVLSAGVSAPAKLIRQDHIVVDPPILDVAQDDPAGESPNEDKSD